MVLIIFLPNKLNLKRTNIINTIYLGLFNLSMDNWSSERAVETNQVKQTNRSAASNWLLIGSRK